MRTSITESDSELKCDYLTTDDREQVLRTHWLTRHAPGRIICTRRLTYTYCFSRHSYSAFGAPSPIVNVPGMVTRGDTSCEWIGKTAAG